MFVALGIQHAMHMRHIILPSVNIPAVPCFSTLSHNWHDFLKKQIFDKKCALIFSITRLTFLILRRTERNKRSLYWSSCEVAVTLVKC